ncbi:MAG TPA: hypothetical protein VNT02_07260, partial [Burkholderiales bacterium]|nr:hypothetical protein [Burkholderiales bacterium]
AAALQEPGFAWFYFINEHVLRLLGTRVPHDYHTGPWWYHLPRLVAYSFPWILLAFAPVRHGADDERLRTRDARRFLWVWLLVPLAVFSLAREKGEYYMMVGMPALTLLLAQRAVALKRIALAVAPLGCLGALLWGQTLVPHIAPYRVPDLYTPLVLAGAAMIALSVAAFASGRRRAGMASAGVTGCVAMALFSGFLGANADLKSTPPIAGELARHPGAIVYLYEDYESLSSLPFYLHANVGVVDSRSADLWFGMTLHPDSERFPDARTFAQRAASSDLWLVIDDRRLDDFRRSVLAPHFATVLRSGRQVLMRSVQGAGQH